MGNVKLINVAYDNASADLMFNLVGCGIAAFGCGGAGLLCAGGCGSAAYYKYVVAIRGADAQYADCKN